MSGKLGTIENEEEGQEVYLRDGRKLTISESGADQVVEIRSDSGMLELRIKLTAEGPVLQMEAVRMQLKASESVDIESERVNIKAQGNLRLDGDKLLLNCDEDFDPSKPSE